ncbi:MAG: hypothetical protein ABR501_01720 [Pyrinomonadaceae bacterium]
MPKDNENAPFQFSATDGSIEPPAPRSFAPTEMVRCESCLRANPPTRVNCLYCAASLPATESTIDFQKPALRPLEKWERGYNNIFLPPSANLSEAALAEAADALKLAVADLSRILAADAPLPLARAATIDEASLVRRRLSKLEINTVIVADSDLGLGELAPFKVRAIETDDAAITAHQTPETPPKVILWPAVVLLVVGRLIVKRVELKEQKGGRAENRISDASEFFSDELVLELYTNQQPLPYRIQANSFDFSCLGERKGLLAHQNMSTLVDLFRTRAINAEFDDSYSSLRQALDAVWPCEQQNESRGWRREGPGRLSLGTVNEISNESQFSRYSRLRFYLKRRSDEA